jgi:hypothetical protein
MADKGIARTPAIVGVHLYPGRVSLLDHYERRGKGDITDRAAWRLKRSWLLSGTQRNGGKSENQDYRCRGAYCLESHHDQDPPMMTHC